MVRTYRLLPVLLSSLDRTLLHDFRFALVPIFLLACRLGPNAHVVRLRVFDKNLHLRAMIKNVFRLSFSPDCFYTDFLVVILGTYDRRLFSNVSAVRIVRRCLSGCFPCWEVCRS